jgi:O-antigen/teichoic acid export membrane protein
MTARLHRNFASIALSNLLAPFFSLALVLAIGRIQGVEALGKYSLVMTCFVVGQVLAGLGLPLIITREVARRPDWAGRYFWHGAALSVACLIPCVAVAAWILGRSMSDGEVALALAVTLVGFLPSAITQCGEAVLLAYERAADFVAVNLAETALRAIFGTALVLLGHGVVAIAGLILILRVLAALAYVAVLHRRGVALRVAFDGELLRTLAREVPVTGAIPVVNTLYARADMFLLSSLASWGEVGLYSAALRLVDLARTLPPAYARALYPVLAKLRAPEHHDRFAAEARRALRWVTMASIAIALGLAGLAEPLMRLLFGPDLVGAAAVLRILAWAVVPLAVAVTLAQMLFAANRQDIDLKVNVAGTIASVTGCALLIPSLGAVGAAIAVVAATTLYATLQYLGVRACVADPKITGDLARLLGVTAAGVACLWAFGQVNAVLATLIACAVYGAGLIATGALSRDELQRAVQALGLRGPSSRRSVVLGEP